MFKYTFVYICDKFVLKNISRRETIGIYIVYDIKTQITLQLG